MAPGLWLFWSALSGVAEYFLCSDRSDEPTGHPFGSCKFNRGQPITHTVQRYNRKYNCSRPVCTRHVTRKSPLSFLGLKFLLTTPALYHSLAATPSLIHGSRVPKTQGAGECYLRVEYGHRNLESREGRLGYCPSQGCFWFRQHYPHNDQSQFPSGSR